MKHVLSVTMRPAGPFDEATLKSDRFRVDADTLPRVMGKPALWLEIRITSDGTPVGVHGSGLIPIDTQEEWSMRMGWDDNELKGITCPTKPSPK